MTSSIVLIANNFLCYRDTIITYVLLYIIGLFYYRFWLCVTRCKSLLRDRSNRSKTGFEVLSGASRAIRLMNFLYYYFLITGLFSY